MTGYYGRPSTSEHSARVTNVHLTNSKGNGLCGYVPHPTMKFQWCSVTPILQYVECATCKRKYLERMKRIYCND